MLSAWLPKVSVSEIVRGGAASASIPPTSFQREKGCETEAQSREGELSRNCWSRLSQTATEYDLSLRGSYWGEAVPAL